MKTRILIIIALAASVAWGANQRLCDTCVQTDLSTAVAAMTADNDTLFIIRGTNSPTCYTEATEMSRTTKLNIVDSSGMDTLAAAGNNHLFSMDHDSIYCKKVIFKHLKTTQPTNFRYIFYSSNDGGHVLDSCQFVTDSVRADNRWSATNFTRTDQTRYCEPIRISSNYFKYCSGPTVSVGSWTTMPESVLVINNTYEGSRIRSGKKWIVRNNRFVAGGGENEYDGDSAYFGYNIFDAATSTGEFHTGDGSGVTAACKHYIIEYNTYINSNHVQLMFDRLDSSTVRYNVFVKSTGTNYPIYNHCRATHAISTNIIFYGNYIYGGAAGSIFFVTDATNIPNLITFRNNIMDGNVGYDLASATNVTIDSSVIFDVTPVITAGTGLTVADTAIRPRSAIILDTVKPFVKTGKLLYNANPYGYIIYRYKAADSIKNTSFVMWDSISSRNKSYATWLTVGDSAKIYKQTSVNKTVWSTVDSSLNVTAGVIVSDTISGLAAGTKYYYRSIAVSGTITDTTAIDSVTTTGGGSVVRTIINKLRVSLDIGL